MPRFAANLTLMFTEHAFLDRFDAAAAAGFEAVEFLFPYAETPDAVAARVERNGLAVALFNMPPGDWENGERGIAAIPGRDAELRDGVSRAIEYADALRAPLLHLMAGNADPADADAWAAYREAVAFTAERLAEHGRALVLEPINKRDMPGYFLNDFRRAEALVRELALPNLALQFDLYHRQILHGDVVSALRASLDVIGHVQAASVPSRHEPDGEELNYPFVFAELDRLGYGGFVGCEYRPRAGTVEGLGWFEAWRPERAGSRG
ncbi:MAG: TIM barrel protein [Gluconacetobacter diazotrophicus]|nr:TIM barrel protein [Gluconacetobacter diazotrophicus]